MLKKFLTLPELRRTDIDGSDIIDKRSDIIQSKRFLKKIYSEWYRLLAASIPEGPGKILELGSGGGFLKKIIPEVITSDVFSASGIDVKIDACKAIPFGNDELKTIAMVDVLHHLPDVASFLKLAEKSLKMGGRIIMIEPWYTPWSGIIYNKLHHEPFNTHAVNWHFPCAGPLSSANGALPWILFERDRDIFNEKFPGYEILEIKKMMPICYLLSGGVSYKSFVPGCFFKFVRGIEKFLKLESLCAMFAFITIEKKPHTFI
ncbi:MAG: class I SAM-dependent methyltransferase [Proteobacteria bacterium]|nr:class I SAM-dependent methyltransferase [Pseudomonadota bacterium]